MAGVLQQSVSAYGRNRVVVVGDVRARTDWKTEPYRLRDLGVGRGTPSDISANRLQRQETGPKEHICINDSQSSVALGKLSP